MARGLGPTLVTEFEVTQRESGGSGDVGFVRGSYSLAFEADGTTFKYTGEYLCLLRRGPDGSWRISHRMWGGEGPSTAIRVTSGLAMPISVGRVHTVSGMPSNAALETAARC